VVSLQELKAEQGAFPVNAELSVRSGLARQRSWNGVAILARNHVPVLTCTSLPGNPEGSNSETRNPADQQARYIEAAVQGVLITSIYLPNGGWPGLNSCPEFTFEGAPSKLSLGGFFWFGPHL
jgi:exodeoxyribonuclease III